MEHKHTHTQSRHSICFYKGGTKTKPSSGLERVSSFSAICVYGQRECPRGVTEPQLRCNVNPRFPRWLSPGNLKWNGTSCKIPTLYLVDNTSGMSETKMWTEQAGPPHLNPSTLRMNSSALVWWNVMLLWCMWNASNSCKFTNFLKHFHSSPRVLGMLYTYTTALADCAQVYSYSTATSAAHLLW